MYLCNKCMLIRQCSLQKVSLTFYLVLFFFSRPIITVSHSAIVSHLTTACRADTAPLAAPRLANFRADVDHFLSCGQSSRSITMSSEVSSAFFSAAVLPTISRSWVSARCLPPAPRPRELRSMNRHVVRLSCFIDERVSNLSTSGSYCSSVFLF